MENALTEKLFGMPAWVWGAIVGVGVAGFTYLHKKNSANATSADTSATQYDANGNPISSDGLAGPQDSLGADQSYIGSTPMTDYAGGGGFNYSPPPPAPAANLRLPQSTINEINQIAKEQQTLKRQQQNLNRKRGRTGPQKGAGSGRIPRPTKK